MADNVCSGLVDRNPCVLSLVNQRAHGGEDGYFPADAFRVEGSVLGINPALGLQVRCLVAHRGIAVGKQAESNRFQACVLGASAVAGGIRIGDFLLREGQLVAHPGAARPVRCLGHIKARQRGHVEGVAFIKHDVQPVAARVQHLQGGVGRKVEARQRVVGAVEALQSGEVSDAPQVLDVLAAEEAGEAVGGGAPYLRAALPAFQAGFLRQDFQASTASSWVSPGCSSASCFDFARRRRFFPCRGLQPLKRELALLVRFAYS